MQVDTVKSNCCFNCREIGHWRKNCPKPQKKLNAHMLAINESAERDPSARETLKTQQVQRESVVENPRSILLSLCHKCNYLPVTVPKPHFTYPE
jgi:hypothetical protein